jgi:catecholate siderophore receptor
MSRPQALPPSAAAQASHCTRATAPMRYRPLPLGAAAAGFGMLVVGGLTSVPAAAQGTGGNAVTEATLPPISVRAQGEPSGKETLRATTTTIGKGRQELRDVPQSVTVVTEKLMDDRNLDTLKEALRNTAGISFLAAEGGEEDIRLRGFSLQATGDIFIDGMRDPAFYERDAFNWDRLEVLRGSASMLFGRGSTGGAVNQVSKQPMLMTEHELALTLGTGRFVRATGDFNLKTGDNAALRITAMAHTADNSGVGTAKRGIAPTLRWGIGTRHEFSVGLYHLENDNGIHYGLPWLTPAPGTDGNRLWPTDPKNFYGMASDYSAGGVSYVQGSHVHRLGDGAELKTAARFGRYERDQRASAVRFAAAALQPNGLAVDSATFSDATVLNRGTQNKLMDMENAYLQSDFSGKFSWGGVAHSLLAGADLALEQFTGYAVSLPPGVALTKPRTTVGMPDDGARVDESLRLRSVNREFEARALGLYVQDMVQVAPAWKLLAGLRWDRFEGDYTTPQIGSTAPTARSRADSLWSRRFGILYQPTPAQSYHLSYGTSFNTSGDAYQYDALGSNTPPERSRNLELGARLDWAGGRYTTRVALFHATKYNERNRDEESVNPTNYVLSGERHAAGIELDVAGRLTPAWEIYASYAFIPDAEVDKASSVNGTTLIGETVGQRPGLTPRHSGTVWTTYRASPRWRIGGGLTARSSDTPQQSTIVAPRFVSADLMAEYTLGATVFKVNLVNVANKHYADVLYRGHYIAGKPRQLQLTVAHRF